MSKNFKSFAQIGGYCRSTVLAHAENEIVQTHVY